MKLLKKTLMAGLAVVLLAGCSEDGLTEQLQNNPTSPEQAPNTGAIAHAPKDASVLRATFAANGGEGWAEGDSVWIFTPNSMLHNSYLLSQGAGSGNGTFYRTGGDNNYEKGETLYALTSPRYLYGFSTTTDGGAQVSITIPNRYKISDVGAPEGSSRMPVPYWGTATFGSDGKLEATFSGLTALLKVDLTTLPTDTRAIILTTHSDIYLGDDVLEDGDWEPLSGTFDTRLTEGAKLTSNPDIFQTFDTLRVNLTPQEAEQYRYVYIPVVAASYTNLHVIAVQGDPVYNSYWGAIQKWEGKLLKTFKPNTPFQPNTIVALEPESTGIRTPRM